LFVAAAGVWLTSESATHLLVAPLYRVIYEPLRAYILYKSALTVLRGARTSWNKLQRLGTVAANWSESESVALAGRPKSGDSQQSSLTGAQGARAYLARLATAWRPAHIPHALWRIFINAAALVRPCARAPPRAWPLVAGLEA
jgi:hypothetical protein